MDILSKIPILDIILGLVILIFVIRGLKKGFIEMIMRVLSLGLSIGLGFFLSKPLGDFFVSIGLEKGAKVIAFLVIFILVMVVTNFIENKLIDLISFTGLDNLDRALGLLLGFVEGAIVAILIVGILSYQDYFDLSKLLDESYIAKYCIKVLFYSSRYRTLINV